jgi:hypothetical protein
MNPFEEYLPEPVLTYPPSLPHDVACTMSTEELEVLRLKYTYTPEDFEYILNRPDFKREYAEWTQRLISEGNSFKLKLRAMSEAFLPQLNEILSSENTAPSVKVDTFKYITKVAGLEPLPEKTSSEASKQTTTRFVVQWGGDGSGQVAIEAQNE